MLEIINANYLKKSQLILILFGKFFKLGYNINLKKTFQNVIKVFFIENKIAFFLNKISNHMKTLLCEN
jgi:hypothetical protein